RTLCELGKGFAATKERRFTNRRLRIGGLGTAAPWLRDICTTKEREVPRIRALRLRQQSLYAVAVSNIESIGVRSTTGAAIPSKWARMLRNSEVTNASTK
ncbi:MAG: hypothetical protein QOI07_2231, partial [Verrucomicrobiota bacterium]